MKLNRGEYFNVPNYITLTRIIAVPLLVVLMMLIRTPEVDHPTWNAWMSLGAAIVFIIASLSDMLDGFLARRANISSDFGKFLDPLADKLLSLAALIMLIPLGRIPAWFVVLLLVREITVTALRGVAANERIVIAASKWGKYKSAFGSFGIAALILHYPFLGVNWLIIGWVFMVVLAAFTIGSGIHYVYVVFKELKKKKQMEQGAA